MRVVVDVLRLLLLLLLLLPLPCHGSIIRVICGGAGGGGVGVGGVGVGGAAGVDPGAVDDPDPIAGIHGRLLYP